MFDAQIKSRSEKQELFKSGLYNNVGTKQRGVPNEGSNWSPLNYVIGKLITLISMIMNSVHIIVDTLTTGNKIQIEKNVPDFVQYKLTSIR